nr:plasmid transfer protein [Enterobacter sp.]
MTSSGSIFKNHNVKAFGQDAALVFEMNSDSGRSFRHITPPNEIDNYYLTLQVAPKNLKREYDWGTEHCVLLKLSQNEVMQLASVFLRIKHSLKIDKRKTSHHNYMVYKNISIIPNDSGGLLLSAGIVPVDKGGLKSFLHLVPVSQMDSVKIGLYLLGYLSQKMPWVSSESIITALRLSENKISK